jgi:hypothetical protein
VPKQVGVKLMKEKLKPSSKNDKFCNFLKIFSKNYLSNFDQKALSFKDQKRLFITTNVSVRKKS